jgi:hypothetical protein
VSLGESLTVKLTQVASGVELHMLVVRGLSPLAEAELPYLVAALRARGVRVARAEVRGGRQGRAARSGR